MYQVRNNQTGQSLEAMYEDVTQASLDAARCNRNMTDQDTGIWVVVKAYWPN